MLLYIYISIYLYIYVSIYLLYHPIRLFRISISSGDAKKQHPLGRVDNHKGPHGEAAIRATRKQGAGVALLELQEKNLIVINSD